APLTIQPVVEIRDNAGLLISTSTLTVTASVAVGSATITAGGAANASGGVATFTNLTLTGSGGVTLAFSIATTPPISVQAAPFAVNSAPATNLGVQTEPAGAVSGSNLTTQPVVLIRDA